jgi:hypothetical protein
MNGHAARRGFLFQDLYLLLRVLRAAGKYLDEAWAQATADPVTAFDRIPLSFGIEASRRMDSTGATVIDWDVLVGNEEEFEVAEVKSGAVTKDDRLAYWVRLRRELGIDGGAKQLLVPVLVVDPEKSDELDKWHGLAAAAQHFKGAVPAEAPRGYVITHDDLLAEALWHVCGNIPQNDLPPAELKNALDTLARFELQTFHIKALEKEVLSLLEILFPNELTDTYLPLLLGWLSGRATAVATPRRLFTIRELLAEIGVLNYAAVLTAGTLKRWRDLWNEAPEGVRSRTRVRLGSAGQSIPANEIQPTAVAALNAVDDRAVVIIGTGGAGKSTFLAQAVAATEQHGELVLWCGADDVNDAEAEQLVSALRFRASLKLLRQPNARVHVYIDGLDEAPSSKRERWAQLLVRLGALKNVRILVSVRDAVWRADGKLRQQLLAWRTVDLARWPEALVLKLLATTAYASTLPIGVVELLRTPIMLDIFWRTFVEADREGLPRVARLQTRHGLLAAFWEERLLRSPRYTGAADAMRQLHALLGIAATAIGSFTAPAEDHTAVQMLLAEGVLVEEGRLQVRLNFRHPLLRDFALAQWCLGTSNEAAAARRWKSILGGLQRYGALRAIAEAFWDSDAASDYPTLTLPGFLHAVVQLDPAAADQIAQFLGSSESVTGLNPSVWRPDLQAALPETFGTNLVAAARLNENPAWAAAVEHWPEDEHWIDDRFLNELWQYTDVLRKRAEAEPGDLRWHSAAQQAALKLRQLAEGPRFATELGRAEGWLKMQLVCTVIPILPDEATLSWIEREIVDATWRTRSFVLEHLVHLASVDTLRTANVFRAAVGLISANGEFRLDLARWGNLMPEQALDWSLAGKDNHRGLLAEFPGAFFPVAIELAEALFRSEFQRNDCRHAGLTELIEIIDPGSTTNKESNVTTSETKDLIDDRPEWSYWQSMVGQSARETCIHVIHEHTAAWAGKDSHQFAAEIAPALRKSRLGSVQTVVLDVLLDHRDDAGCQRHLRDAALDRRLYFISGTDYWLEQNLTTSWPSLTAAERDTVQATIAAMLSHERLANRAKSLLTRLPAHQWCESLHAQRPADGDAEYKATRRPKRERDDEVSDMTYLGHSDDKEETEAPGEWPDSIDAAALLEFRRATFVLGQSDVTTEAMQTQLLRAVATAAGLVRACFNDPPTLGRSANSWFWSGLARTLSTYRKLSEKIGSTDSPPAELVRGCGELAFIYLRDVPTELPGQLPERDVWTGFRETTWTRAFELADEALTWPPLASEETLQTELVTILEKAFATGNPLVQLTCNVRLRPWHWFRSLERRTLFNRLVLDTPTEPAVLQWSLGHCLHYNDADRTAAFRRILNRADLGGAADLAHRLGEYIGTCALLVFPSGRSAAAELTRDVVRKPDTFALLKIDANRRSFWHGFSFGLKERAKLVSANAELAPDYGAWLLTAWRELLPGRLKRNESEGVVLFAMHWIERKEATATDARILLPWWMSIQPLLIAVAQDGGTADCFCLFFKLRGDEFNHVATPEEVLQLGEIFSARIIEANSAGKIDLDARNPERQEHHSWRECAEYAASGIDALRAGGLLRTDAQRDRAHRLLVKLSTPPLRSSNAVAALHRLQQD